VVKVLVTLLPENVLVWVLTSIKIVVPVFVYLLAKALELAILSPELAAVKRVIPDHLAI
jgi:hypothetical protein